MSGDPHWSGQRSHFEGFNLMTTQINRATEGHRNGAPLFYAGWAGFALFGTLASLGDHADLSYAVFHVAVAAAICIWYFLTKGSAAPIVGGVLGTLYFLQMCLFLFSDLFSGENTPLKTTLGDAFGLTAAVLILTGVVLGFRSARTR
jgi:hypothetical protein